MENNKKSVAKMRYQLRYTEDGIHWETVLGADGVVFAYNREQLLKYINGALQKYPTWIGVQGKPDRYFVKA